MYQYIRTGAGGQAVLRLSLPACVLCRADPVLGLPFVLVAHRRGDAPRLAWPSLKMHCPPLAVDLLHVHAWVGATAMRYALERGPVPVAVVVVRLNDRLAIRMAKV